MNNMKDKQRTIFLMAGVALAILSTASWGASWYLPETQLGHDIWTYVALTTYALSLIALLLWMTRLKSRQLIPAVVFLLIASVIVYVLTQLIEMNYLEFFSFTRELFRGKSIEEYAPRYVMNWGYMFLYPFLYVLNGVMALLSLSAFVVWGIKRRKDAKASRDTN
jgi:hypothetical protein